jgi:hypothetical protein
VIGGFPVSQRKLKPCTLRMRGYSGITAAVTLPVWL